MFHERALQVTVVSLHSFRAPAPRPDRSFGERFAGVGNHQLGVDNQLCAKPVTGWTSAEMTIEGKMFRGELAKRKSGLCISIISRVAQFLPFARWSGGVAPLT